MRGGAERETIDVVAGVIERDGRILITWRRPDAHLAGLWEFPGGKPLPGEPHEQALRRELREELDLHVTIGEPLDVVEWRYPDKHVRLFFFRCSARDEPTPLEAQEIAWVSPAELARYEFPPADATLIERLSRG